MFVFETPRLLGRRLEPQDLEPMLAVYGDLEAMRFVGDGTALSREDCARWLAVTAENYEKRATACSPWSSGRRARSSASAA